MPQTNYHEQQFFNALRDIFVGARVEGDSGFINLMRIKSRYYTRGVFPHLQKDIDAAIAKFPEFREELFDKLYSFFQRYFSESGSIYFRYTPLHQNIYEKVYTDDRDVVLFWKTHMLYYVKTDRIFNSLAVEVDDVKFFFDARQVEHKRANEKREVVFSFRKVRQDETIVFEVTYSERGRKTKEEDILRDLKRAGFAITDEMLNKAFRVFEKQSEVDYFINKNARAFLQEQFELWMYQYMFEGQNVWSAERLAQLQALKSIAFKVIDFISQFEDELVKVWNKPKFVRNSHYVLTLDHIKNIVIPKGTLHSANEVTHAPHNVRRTIVPPSFGGDAGEQSTPLNRDCFVPRSDIQSPYLLERLFAHPDMAAQIEEWRELGMLDDKSPQDPETLLALINEKDLTGEPLHPEYRHLPLDTKHFPELELEVLALFDDLDDALDGWLVHSENYQANNSLMRKFHKSIKCVYIDPPYNADGSEIPYLNVFRSSSWLSMMANRLNFIPDYLQPGDSALIIAIDDYEAARLTEFSKEYFTGHDVNTIVVNHHPQGSPKANISRTHEYALLVTPKDTDFVRVPREIDKPDERSFMRTGTGENNFRYGRPNSFYAILVDPVTGNIKGIEPPPINEYQIEETKEGLLRIYPIDSKGQERVWRKSYNSAIQYIGNGIVVGRMGNNGPRIFEATTIDRVKATSNWFDSKYNAGTHGTALLTNLFGENNLFAYPKSLNTVLDMIDSVLYDDDSSIVFDYFAGSGTTAHAVMNLNRKDDGKRKYILVEMGEHFHTVILPRIKKVAFNSKWKDGKPVFAKGESGMSQFVKYYDLEQYEEVLQCAHYEDADLFNDPNQDPYHAYVFLRDLKLLDSLEIDPEANQVHFHPERLYPDPSSPFGTSIDLAETLSHLRGKWIKHITKDYVEFQDGEQMSLSDPDWQTLKPMIWWQ